jgi:hypothetical protein
MDAPKLRNALPLSGRLDIELDYTHDTPDRLPRGTGKVRLANLKLKGNPLTGDLEGDLLLADGVIRLRRISAEVARGLLRAQLAYNLNDPERSSFSMAFDDVDAAELLAPWLGERIKGTMQARIRGTLGASWRGTADLELTRGELFGLEVSQWRVPATWEYAPGTNRAELDVPDTSLQIARGRTTGKVNLKWDDSLRVEGNVRFFGMDLQTMLRQTIGPSELASGELTGRFDFSGSDVRSINELSGNIVASFRQAQALQLPVLRQVAPYAGMGQSTTFQRGDLRARLDRGVLRITQLGLEGGNLQLHADGTVNLEGRLNLNVVAKNRDVGLPTARLGAIGLRIPIAGPVPVTLLQQASNLLANRVIYLEVTGTARNPVIGVRPLPLLSEEAVRFSSTGPICPFH